MNTSTLSQAREGFHTAARMVSVRAAMPFTLLDSWSDTGTYAGIGLVIVSILYLIRQQFRSDTGKRHIDLHKERNLLEKRLALRTEEYIRAESERLAEMDRTVQFGELSKGLFHDLMSPLSTISLYIEKLHVADKESEIVEKVVTISKRMNSFMESVRHSMNTIPSSHISDADLKEEIDIAKDIFTYKARAADVTLTISEASHVLLPIHPVRLHQLLSNLISNAIDACVEDKNSRISRGNEPKEYTVSVETTQSPDGVMIKISDNGQGMTDEKRSSLFESPSSTKTKGLGIGLITVQKIVEEAGGSISVVSKYGKGSTFCVLMPHKNKTLKIR